MPIAIASWSQELVPGKAYSADVPRDFRITNAALGDELADPAGRSVVKVTITEHDSDSEDSEDEDEPSGPIKSVLCSLRAGSFEQVAMDVTFLEGQTVEFSVTGKNKVFLLGNYIDQGEDDMPPGMGGDLDSDDEGAFRLEDVSSDVEMDPADLAGLGGGSDSDDADRFAEVAAKPASKKRAAPPESAGKDKDKKDKKQKGNDGKAAKPDSKAKPESKPKADGGKPKSQGGGKPQSNGAGAGAGKPKSKGDKPKSKGGKK
ncbi:hypothetical protein AURDEDRAFT_112334 [Auricularia subglabra TFB-10046 SS5]|nr:hypothetical protein AURDEDRAFT_112334 [Auricularia subglabra TFB-10046 SS5]